MRDWMRLLIFALVVAAITIAIAPPIRPSASPVDRADVPQTAAAAR
jgi:hypothetical protein